MDQLWFGTRQRFQWVPNPGRGVQPRTIANSSSGTLERGGGYASRSFGRNVEYDFTFPTGWEAHGPTGLDIFQEYADGLWNDFDTVVNGFNPNDLIHFADPMNYRANLCVPHFAAPMLGLTGDWPWPGEYVSQAATAANSYRQPQRTVTFGVT